MPSSRSRTAVALVAVLLGIGVAGACADDSSGDDVLGSEDTDDTDQRWPGDGGPTETRDLGEGLAAELPEGWEITPFQAVDTRGGQDGCTSMQGSVGDDEDSVELQLNSAGCAGIDASQQIGNGYHGTYVTLDDVPEPRDVEEHGVAAGSLTTFSQDYFECTNECNDYEDHVGLLELTTPPDAGHPTLVLVDARGDLSVDQLVALADAIHPG